MAARGQDTHSQSTVSFAGQLHAALDRISDRQAAARVQAEKFTLGEPGIALNDVMADMQKRPSHANGDSGAQQAGRRVSGSHVHAGLSRG